MEMVLNNVNLIRGGNKAQRHRAFIHLRKKWMPIMVKYPYISDIRWLSAEKCLQRIFSLRKEILLFHQTEHLGQESQRKLQDMEFIFSLAFLADLTSHLNTLNFKLQSKGQNISHLVGHIEGLRIKLKLFDDVLQKVIRHFFIMTRTKRKLK
jgi:hypothetical protein